MRRRIEALADQLEEFVSEDGHDALVITCAGEGVGLVGAAVDLNEQRGSTDVSLAFLDEASSEATLIAALHARIDALETQRALPRTVAGSLGSLDALVERLVGLARAVRVGGDVRLAVWLCPRAIPDVDAYAALVVRLVGRAREVSPPIRVGTRAPGDGWASELRTRGLATLELELDTSRSAVRDALARDAMDSTLDASTRAAATLAVVMGDAAEGQDREALAVLATLADFHHARGDTSSRALCFVLAATLLARIGELDEARQRVAQGLALAIEARSLAVTVQAAVTAGALAMRAADPADAEQHFELAARLAARIGHAAWVAHALMGRGEARLALDRPRDALEAFGCAALAARRAGSPTAERAALAAMASLFRGAGLRDAARVLQARLAKLEACAPCAGHEHGP